MFCIFISIMLLIIDVNGKIYFQEEFNNDDWENTWIHSEYPGKEWGKFILSTGEFFGDPEISKGIKTSQDARFYGLSTKFEPFSNENKVLVVQFTVKHEQNIDCGGGYIKLFDCSLKPKNLHGETPYLIMFGPDICGYNTVQIIFNYKGKNVLAKKKLAGRDDAYTHLYTLIVKPDNTYIVKIDNFRVLEGELENDWDFLLPRTIKDPNVTKPKDWVDEPKIVDTNDKKPDDWDQPEFIPDNSVAKPEDWDDDIDGDWEPPMINNPEFKGEWKPKMLTNPKYKGPWNHPEINNPAYEPDLDLYKYAEICGVGFDLWQVKSGTIFDNILIADSEEQAIRHSETTWEAIKEREKEMKKQLEEKNSEVTEDYDYEHNDQETDFSDEADGHDEL